jgi:hypothetical protein
MANIPLHLQGLAIACPLCEAAAFFASTQEPASGDVICCAACGGRYTYGFLLKRTSAGRDENPNTEATTTRDEQPSRDVSAKVDRPRNDPTRLTEYLVKEIAQAAYFRAQNRGFAPGHEKQDWFEAESTMLQTRSTQQSTR